MKTIFIAIACVGMSFVTDVSGSLGAPHYKIVPLGFDDLEHTRNDGYKYSSAYQLNEAGQVCGTSDRYNGSTNLGQTVWLYDGATTIDIGLTGAEHTGSDGSKYSEIEKLNEAGQVTGDSARYNGGGTEMGRTAWFYNGATTIAVGLTGAEHTGSDGYQLSYTHALNEAGQVIGDSARFNGGSIDLGGTVWLYDGATTIVIGFSGAEHTRSDGYKWSSANELNEAGQVNGSSDRFNGGSVDMGYSAWLYDGTQTIDIGLSGSEYTRNDGYKDSSAGWLNEAGQVSGSSVRYDGGASYLGETAWLYNGATTVNIGLSGPEHTRSDGYKFSYTNKLNEGGQIIGNSARFNGGGINSDFGQTAWLYNGLTMVQIGLIGTEQTRNDGYRLNYAALLNEAGQASGVSERYNGGSVDMGYSSWLYDGTATIDIGLSGSEYTRNDGYQFNSVIEQFNIPIGMNEAGQVAGFAKRFNGGSTDLGQDAWLFDPVLHHTFPLRLSTRSDGFAFSSVQYLSDDGLVLGTYRLFDSLDNNLGDRAFYFTVADGLHDLSSLVDGGMPGSGWKYLAAAFRGNTRGQILGYGKLSSQSSGSMAFLLTPIPEPSAVALAAIAAFGVASRVRRQRNYGRSPTGVGSYQVRLA